MTDAEVRAAIATCQEAFEAWSERPLAERAAVMTGVGEALTARKDELAAMMTQEMGKLLSQSRQEVDLCAVSAPTRPRTALESSLGSSAISARARRPCAA